MNNGFYVEYWHDERDLKIILGFETTVDSSQGVNCAMMN